MRDLTIEKIIDSIIDGYKTLFSIIDFGTLPEVKSIGEEELINHYLELNQSAIDAKKVTREKVIEYAKDSYKKGTIIYDSQGSFDAVKHRIIVPWAAINNEFSQVTLQVAYALARAYQENIGMSSDNVKGRLATEMLGVHDMVLEYIADAILFGHAHYMSLKLGHSKTLEIPGLENAANEQIASLNEALEIYGYTSSFMLHDANFELKGEPRNINDARDAQHAFGYAYVCKSVSGVYRNLKHVLDQLPQDPYLVIPRP